MKTFSIFALLISLNVAAAPRSSKIELGEQLGYYDQFGTWRIDNAMTQIEAAKACKKIGSRLPTVRELLESHVGSNGQVKVEVISVAEYERISRDPNYHNGHHLVEVINPGGSLDRFYYSTWTVYDDTNSPQPKSEANWTSSLAVGDPARAYYFVKYHPWVHYPSGLGAKFKHTFGRPNWDRGPDLTVRCLKKK